MEKVSNRKKLEGITKMVRRNELTSVTKQTSSTAWNSIHPNLRPAGSVALSLGCWYHPLCHLQEKRGQQVERGDSAPLLCSGETSPGVLRSALEPSA